ncbi:MAG TPA: tRNA pseudouridine(55) synthase TruB [Terriglobia bacterium]|nr:tRNA pseudouridine(55) synthase TruB [Terriglobia bacterium]
MNGILVIDKPEGMTSHDVVLAIRKKFHVEKAGHLGTLDPMATGVLPVCVGKATRVAQYVPNSPKEYTGEIRFGFWTNTYDREGSPASEEKPLASDAGAGEIREAMQSLTGVLDQAPPPFSAKKIGGVPSYKLARRNLAVEIAPSRVEVQQFELLGFEPPFARFRVVCSPGTYVRSLAHDLGQKLGCGAHLSALRRTRSGEFRVEEAVPLDRAAASNLISMDRLLTSWPRIDVSETDEVKVVHGNQIRGDCAGDFARIFNKKGEFIAVASVESGWVRPRLVLTSINSG